MKKSSVNVNHEWTLMRCVECARRHTIEAANAKDYKLTRKRDRRLKEIAKELVENGRGYIIATDVELQQRYPDLVTWRCEQWGRKIIWAIRFDSITKVGDKMAFVPIR